jgi:membrane-associated phospholipid phosphatase
MVSFFFGAICNAVFGKVLKKILNIERPDIAAVDGDSDDAAVAPKIDVIDSIDRPSDNGMPSSHAMSLGFICTFVALLLPTTTIPLLAYASISLIYRVKVNLHSVDQIAVGAVLGTVDGALWWQLCSTNGWFFHGFNLVDWVSASGVMNEYGLLPWYFLAVPALIGAAVVGSVERRLGKYLRSCDETRDSKQE